MKHSHLRRAVVALCLGAAAAAATATAAAAAPVVVGRVNAQTRQITIYDDRMVKSFLDGTPIQRLYGGYSLPSKAYFLVRSGPVGASGCFTEVFRLVKLADHSLALADPANPLKPWRPTPILQRMFATFDCRSFDCFQCDSSADPHGAMTSLEAPSCVCSGGGGQCETLAPGTAGSYGAADILLP